MINSNDWQLTGYSDNNRPIYRLKVFGGWLINYLEVMFFYPDPQHEWDGSAIL